MKTQMVLFAVLALNLACKPSDVQVPEVAVTPKETYSTDGIVPDVAATPAPAIDDQSVSPVIAPEASLPQYCIPKELRSVFNGALPTSASALKTALITSGVQGREANPTCLMARAVTVGDTVHIPCMVNIDEGRFYTLMSQVRDREWIHDAMSFDADSKGLALGEVAISIESNIQFPHVLSSQAALLNSSLVMVSIDTSKVEFEGMCQ